MINRNLDVEFVRVRSDYLGAGPFLPLPGDRGLAVNTAYGVQAVRLDGSQLWRVELVERCLGLTRAPDGAFIAATVHAIHRLTPEGGLIDTRPTRHGLTGPVVPWEGGVLLATRTRIYALDAAGEVRWRYRLRASLGDSVQEVFTLAIVPRASCIAVAAVDQDSGLGRVLVLDGGGELVWQSDAGPVSDLFPAGDDELVYTLSGYGRFESVRVRCDGTVRWEREGGGCGRELGDGRIALLFGNNEAPTWNDWELRITQPDGEVVRALRARGRCAHAPVLGPDGSLYFSGFDRPIDPAESRIDYTSYVRAPRFVVQDHLLRDRARPEYDVFFFRADIDAEDPRIDLLFRDSKAYSAGPPVAGEHHVFFPHQRDILAIEVKGDAAV